MSWAFTEPSANEASDTLLCAKCGSPRGAHTSNGTVTVSGRLNVVRAVWEAVENTTGTGAVPAVVRHLVSLLLNLLAYLLNVLSGAVGRILAAQGRDEDEQTQANRNEPGSDGSNVHSVHRIAVP